MRAKVNYSKLAGEAEGAGDDGEEEVPVEAERECLQAAVWSLVLHVLSRRQGACLRCGLGATGTARNEWQNAAVREVVGKWVCQWALHPPLQV